MSGFPARPAVQLTLYLATRDRAGHHSLRVEVLRVARACQVAGLTVFEAAEGYGGSGQEHRVGPWRTDAPLTVVVVDTAQQIARLVAALREDLGEHFGDLMATVADVEVVDV